VTSNPRSPIPSWQAIALYALSIWGCSCERSVAGVWTSCGGGVPWSHEGEREMAARVRNSRLPEGSRVIWLLFAWICPWVLQLLYIANCSTNYGK
jgi:hypothetical protein